MTTLLLDTKSNTVSARTIADYREASGALRADAGDVHRERPGDIAKLADAIIELIDAPNPPLRLPFGSDTLDEIARKHAQTRDLIARRGSLFTSDVDGGNPS